MQAPKKNRRAATEVMAETALNEASYRDLVITYFVPYVIQTAYMLHLYRRDGMDISWLRVALYLGATYLSSMMFFDLAMKRS